MAWLIIPLHSFIFIHSHEFCTHEHHSFPGERLNFIQITFSSPDREGMAKLRIHVKRQVDRRLNKIMANAGAIMHAMHTCYIAALETELGPRTRLGLVMSF